MRVFIFSILCVNLNVVAWFAVPSSSLECDLYLAESTIPNSGMGILTAVEKKVGETVGNGDVVFPLVELTWHHGYAKVNTRYNDPFSDYAWGGPAMGMGQEVGSDDVYAIWPGLDCATNSLIPLENVQVSFPKHNSHGDDLPYMPHRARDPGAGAITTYRSSNTLVKRDIPPGGELFKSYGDGWFTSRTKAFDKGFPVLESFIHAHSLLEKYANHHRFPSLYETLLEIRDVWKDTSRTLNALPANMDELSIALEKDIGETYQSGATRSLEWLQEHGTCIDHIVHRESTIPGAGEGGFAKRDLPKGTVITGSPLIIIPNESLFDMRNFTLDEKMGIWIPSATFTRQIIFNYCLGHEDSTMLLFPYGSVGTHFINHNSSRANVKIQWAPTGNLRHNATLLNLTPEEMYQMDVKPGLGIEYVALKDISEGEELFIDYGDSWENAWQHHVKHWTPPVHATVAADWNKRLDEPIRTTEEQVSNPYPSNIVLRCHVNLLRGAFGDEKTWARYDYPTTARYFVYGLPCDILERSEDGSAYKVALLKDGLTFVEFPGDHDLIVVEGAPRQAMFFLDAEYQSDLYLKGAFRHHIRIPDEMMPNAWRNKHTFKKRTIQTEE